MPDTVTRTAHWQSGWGMPLPSALSKTRLLQLDHSPSSGRFTSPFRAEFNQDFHFGLLAALIVHSCKWFAITILAVLMALRQSSQ